MKIRKVLTVNDQEVGLIYDDVRLELNSPGRATFTVRSDKPLSDLVILDAGWNQNNIFRFFIGYIEYSITINAQQQKLFCRELTAILSRELPLALRKVTLKDVAQHIGKLTGLSFALPDADYCRRIAPFYYHLGNGYQAIDQLGKVYQIPSYLWQLQQNSKVYLGSWKHSRWANRPIILPDKIFTRHLSFNSAMIPMIPSIRPGVQFNRGVIDSVHLTGNNMVISWKPSKESSTGYTLN